MEIYYTAYIHYFDCTDYVQRLRFFDHHPRDNDCFIACKLNDKIRYLIVYSGHPFSRIKTEEFPYPCTIIKQHAGFDLVIINEE